MPNMLKIEPRAGKESYTDCRRSHNPVFVGTALVRGERNNRPVGGIRTRQAPLNYKPDFSSRRRQHESWKR